MKQLFHSVIRFCLALFFMATAFPLWAQGVNIDSGRINRRNDSEHAIGRLRAAMRQNVNSLQAADSLLRVSRQLADLPGQLVALGQLAGIYFNQQQSDQAAALLQEAGRIAIQIRDVREAGWAMSQVGRMQRNSARSNPAFLTALMPVLDSLGESMRTGRVDFKQRGYDVSSTHDGFSNGKRPVDKRSFQATPTDNVPSILLQPLNLMLNHHGREKPDFVDRLLDTLIQSGGNNPQTVRQLTERKKLRDSSRALSKAFASEGDYAKAYRYYLQYTAYKDSLTTEATTRRLASLQYKQNLLKKEAQIQLLTKDQQLRDQESHRQRLYVFLMIGCIVLLIAFSVNLTRNYRAKHLANQQLSEQKEALQLTLSQLKTTQTQLIQAEKMASLGELTAGIAHEIQNPLNFVNNFSEVSTELVTELEEEQQKPDRDIELEGELLGDLKQNLQKITQHGNRAAAIVKGMLEHARPSGGQKERTDINALVEEYVKLAYHGIRAKDKSFDATLTTVLDPGLSPVTVVPQEIGRVLLNIVNNAFYAVQKRQQCDPLGYHPEVVVRTSQETNQIRITIRDNGIGVPASIRQKIFQPFFTTKPTGQGTGLGLSLSYDIITKGHGGTFTLESEEDRFTELVLTLPIVD